MRVRDLIPRVFFISKSFFLNHSQFGKSQNGLQNCPRGQIKWLSTHFAPLRKHLRNWSSKIIYRRAGMTLGIQREDKVYKSD